MEVQTKPQEWRNEQGVLTTSEGHELNDKNLKDICSYYKIPQTLLKIDNRYGTTTFFDVLRKAVPEVSYRTHDKGVVIMDPLSRFVELDEFMPLVESVTKETGIIPEQFSQGLSERVEWNLDQEESDTVFGDAFQRKIIIERLPQGGVSYSTGVLRLICSNGCRLMDSTHSKLARRNLFAEREAKELINATQNCSLEEYFKGLFTIDGEPMPASVAHVRAMKSTLARIINEDVAAMHFPMEQIKVTYEEQGIDLDRTNSMLLERLPSGLAYYEAFNILTHGAKMAEQTLDTQVEIAKLARLSRMKLIKQLMTSARQAPYFTEIQKKRWMGDL